MHFGANVTYLPAHSARQILDYQSIFGPQGWSVSRVVPGGARTVIFMPNEL